MIGLKALPQELLEYIAFFVRTMNYHTKPGNIASNGADDYSKHTGHKIKYMLNCKTRVVPISLLDVRNTTVVNTQQSRNLIQLNSHKIQHNVHQ